MIQNELAAAISTAVSKTYDVKPGLIEVDYAQPGFGDFASNVAFGLAKELKKAPREIAAKLAEAVKHDSLERVEAAGGGYINMTLTDEGISRLTETAPATKPASHKGQVVVTEYSDPNPFKVLHVGHLYTSVVGDAISNLIRLSGGKVHPVNFGGDVGLHVARNMWAMLKDLGGEKPEKLADIVVAERPEWMAACYVKGTQAYEESEEAKTAIIELNKRIYGILAAEDHKSPLAQIYWTCRGWSYDYFEVFYARIGTKFDKYYPESMTAPLGIQTVQKQLENGVFERSDGAVVFRGEPYGLHTRVFITSNGLPTYEAKDTGLILAKWQDYHFDRSVVITGNDILEYMKVVQKSVEQYEPELAKRSTHITHGNVKLAGGVKMSSRKGNFLRASDVLDVVAEANKAANGSADDVTVLGAIKYAFLKQRIGADIVFAPEESVSLEGNSGPYLQYAHARARSILGKAADAEHGGLNELEDDERSLAVIISRYPDVLDRAVDELMPHHIATYLYELAQVFNRFYEHNRVIGDSRESVRLRLVALYAGVLKDGLGVLGIEAPDRL